MAEVLTTTSTLNNLLSTYFVRAGLTRLVPRAFLYQFAQKTQMPKGEGTAIVFNAWSNFSPATAAISEGVSPALQSLSSRKVTATLAQYVRGAKLTDLIDYTSSLDAYKGAAEVLADSAEGTIEYVIQTALFKALAQNRGTKILSAVMSAVASAFHAGGATTTSTQAWGFPVVFGTTATRLSAVGATAPSVSARMSLYAIRKAVKQLKAKNARPFADGYFKMVSNSDAVADLMSDPDFKQWYQYTTPKPMETAVMDKYETTVEGCRVYQSNWMPKYRGSAHSCDVSFIFGEGAYGAVDITGGKGYQVIIKRPGPNDTSNPADLYGTATYKISMVAKALNVSSGRTLFTHVKP